MAAAGSTSTNPTLSIQDRKSGIRHLVDSGAAVCVTPASAKERRRRPSTTLTAANGSPIRTWGTRNISVHVGKRTFTHTVFLADVTRSILGADFFVANNLAIDLRGRRLIDMSDASVLAV